MRHKARPCPICGNTPEVDTGLKDVLFEYPLISCPTVHMTGDITSSCPMHAQGIEAWNYICEIADKNHPLVAEAYEMAAKAVISQDYTQKDLGQPEEGKAISGVTIFDNRNRDTPKRAANAIRALTPADAIAAREARDVDVWNEAIEAAAEVAREMANAHGPNGTETAIRFLIKKDKTDE